MKRRHFVRAEEPNDHKLRGAVTNSEPLKGALYNCSPTGVEDESSAAGAKAERDSSKSYHCQQLTANESPLAKSSLTQNDPANAIVAPAGSSSVHDSSADGNHTPVSDASSDDSCDEASSASDSSASDSRERPTFVRKQKPRSAAVSPKTSRRNATLAMLAQEQTALQPIKELAVDDTDDLDPAAEYAAWKGRQLARQRRDAALAEEAHQRHEHAVATTSKRMRTH